MVLSELLRLGYVGNADTSTAPQYQLVTFCASTQKSYVRHVQKTLIMQISVGALAVNHLLGTYLSDLGFCFALRAGLPKQFLKGNQGMNSTNVMASGCAKNVVGNVGKFLDPNGALLRAPTHLFIVVVNKTVNLAFAPHVLVERKDAPDQSAARG